MSTYLINSIAHTAQGDGKLNEWNESICEHSDPILFESYSRSNQKLEIQIVDSLPIII
jgi:hypothetical protein